MMRLLARFSSKPLAALTLISAGLAFGAVADAQQPPAASVVLSAVRVEGNDASVSASVVDAAGNPVGALPASAFLASIDGTAALLRSADTSLDPALTLGLVLVVDTSGSMAGASLTAARAAINSLVASTQPGDHVALITFSSTVVTPVPFTAERKTVTGAVSALSAGGNTALYAAVATAATLSAAAPDPRKAVVLLTDGEDFGGASAGVTRDAALAAARSVGAPFYVVGLGAEVDTPFLAALGSAAGGAYFPAGSAADLATLYNIISERLRAQYTLRISLPAGLAPGGHRLKVAVGAAAGEASFTRAVIAAGPSLSGLEGPISELRTINLGGLPANTRVDFAVDGKAFPAEADGHSIRIDPFAFDPSAEHTLVATYTAGDTAKVVNGSFTVAPLAPNLLAPISLPNLQRGDFVRFTVQAQPGTSIHATYSLDGNPVAQSDGPPFEYTLPPSGLASGTHTLSAAFETNGGRTERSFAFPGPETTDTPTAAYVLIALSALAAVATVLYGARLVIVRLRARHASQADPAGDRRERQAESAVNAAPPNPPWGVLVAITGRQAGQRFVLRDDRVLIGSSKSCGVRLSDPSVQTAHAVLTPTPSPAIIRSAPNCSLAVNGEDTREAPLAAGTSVRIGAVELRFELPEPENLA